MPDGVTPEDIFHYVYAIFHSPSYRTRYQSHLQLDYPRVPLPKAYPLFQALAHLGGELTALHLMESRQLERPITVFRGSAKSEVTKVRYDKRMVSLDDSQTVGFVGVPEAVWNFEVGGFQICEKWLKDRRGRTLSRHDVGHYHKIVVALNETIRLMTDVDEVIGEHGGWPSAFAT